jgi:hypothetical protein
MAKKRATKHGMCKTRVYRIWKGMKQRCLNPRNPDYPEYGGCGRGLHPDWHPFVSFFADVGHQDDTGLSLDRRDNDKGYGPTNWRWATRSEQARNQRPRKRKKQKAWKW